MDYLLSSLDLIMALNHSPINLSIGKIIVGASQIFSDFFAGINPAADRSKSPQRLRAPVPEGTCYGQPPNSICAKNLGCTQLS